MSSPQVGGSVQSQPVSRTGLCMGERACQPHSPKARAKVHQQERPEGEGVGLPGAPLSGCFCPQGDVRA